MKLRTVKFLAGVTFTLAICGCSFTSDSLFPSIMGSDKQENEASNFDRQLGYNNPPKLGSTDFKPIDITTGGKTGTFVGQKVVAFRGELKQLQDTIRFRNNELQKIRTEISKNTSQYHEIVAGIRSKLQMGTTHGNPILFAKWQNAQTTLQNMNSNLIVMNRLSTQVASDSAMTAYLLDSIRAAFNISGAIDEDHKQLNILEDETSQSSVLIERLLKELNADITRQQKYTENEKNTLNSLSQAIKVGSLYNTNRTQNTVVAAPADNKEVKKTRYTSRPLFVVRFNKPNVPYEQGLYHAVKKVLEAKSNAEFEIVAISPSENNYSNGISARKNAEAVLKSLISMGMPAERINLSSQSSEKAETPEVHLYIK